MSYQMIIEENEQLAVELDLHNAKDIASALWKGGVLVGAELDDAIWAIVGVEIIVSERQLSRARVGV